MVDTVPRPASCPTMYARCAPIPGPVTCRNRESASSGNHTRASSAHRSWLTGTPPGTRPAASAAATYLRTVFRDSPRLLAISFLDRPAGQCTQISELGGLPRTADYAERRVME